MHVHTTNLTSHSSSDILYNGGSDEGADTSSI